MTNLTKSTVHMICARAEISRKEIPIEAQKLLDLYNDPSIPAEEKAAVKKKLDDMIQKLEDKVETNRHLRRTQPE